MCRSLFGSCLVLFVVGSVSAYGQEGEVKTSTNTAKEKMKVLAGYIGEWKVESEREQPDGTKKKVVEPLKNEWLYEGLWIKSTTELELPMGQKMKMTSIYGWDDATQQFKSSTFTDKGTASESIGTWDPATKSVTWATKIEIKGSDLKIKFMHRTKFDSPDQFSTVVLFTDPEGKETTTRTVSRRVKAKEPSKKDG